MSSAVQNINAARRFLENSNIHPDGRLWTKRGILEKWTEAEIYKYAELLLERGSTRKYVADQVCHW